MVWVNATLHDTAMVLYERVRATFHDYFRHTVATLQVSDVTIGLLPEPIRTGFGYPWSPRRQRILDRSFAATTAVYPHLPWPPARDPRLRRWSF